MRTGKYRAVTNGAKFFVEELHTHCFLWWSWERWRLAGGYWNVYTKDNIWVDRCYDTAEEAATWMRSQEVKVQAARDAQPYSLEPVVTKESNE